MDWKGKVNAILLALMLLLVTVGALRVLTEQDAIDLFNSGANVEFLEGRIESCEKEVSSVADVSKDYTAKFVVLYRVNGETKAGRGEFQTKDCSARTLKPLAKTAFEAARTTLTQEYQTPAKITIGREGSPITEFYDMVSRVWVKG